MSRIKCYIDGENVTLEEVLFSLRTIDDTVRPWEVVEYRIYGGKGCSHELRSFCESAGWKWVETMAITGGKKVADIEIVTDALLDVVTEKDISVVWIITKDCDFTPLVKKLLNFGIVVRAPLLFQEAPVKVGEIASILRKAGWDPMADGVSAFFNQRKKIRALLGDEFSDVLIEQFLDVKKNNFFKALRAICDIEFVERLMKCSEFDFRSVVKEWRHSKMNKNALYNFAKCYTNKFYGISFNDKQNKQYVNELIRKER